MTYKGYEITKGSITAPSGITVNGYLITGGDLATIAQDVEIAKHYIDYREQMNTGD